MDAKYIPSTSSLDPNALGALRSKARAEDPQAIEAAAKQFESLFLNQLLKSMREAQKGDGEGIFDSNESKMYTGLLDEQLANRIANGRGIGLADMVIAQIERSRGSVPVAADTAGSAASATTGAAAGAAAAVVIPLPDVKNPPMMPITVPGARHGG